MAIEAEAAFAELKAKNAAQEAISAAGWSTEAGSTPPEPAVEDRMPTAALDAHPRHHKMLPPLIWG